MSATGEGVGTLALSVLVSLALVGGGLFVGKRHLDRELAARPRVVFLDELRVVRESPPGTGTPRDQAEAAVRRAEAAAQALADEGYLVLDRSAIYAAPAGLEVVP